MKRKSLGASIRLVIGTLSICSGIPAAYAAIDATTVCGDATNPKVTQISVTQCNALVSLYNSTDGDNWTKKDNWGDSTKVCRTSATTPGWQGVGCQNGNVISLSLPNNKLKGPLPDLSAFTELQTLNLKKNQLSDSLATAKLGSLTKLQTLDVSTNQLSGPLPAVSSLTQLQTLAINDNPLFTGTLPNLSALLNLDTINCNNAGLTGAIPALNTLTTLQTFTCSGNQLSGAIPALDKLKFLGTFDVSSNATDPTSNKPLLCKDAAQAYGDKNKKILSDPPNSLEDCVTTITGTVFNDMDGNGTKDQNDNGRANQAITLTVIKADSTSDTRTATTDSQGKYLFKDVPLGTYTLTLDSIPTGWTQTAPKSGDSNPTLAASQTTELNFGLQPPAAINLKFVTSTSDTTNPGVGAVTFEADGFSPQTCLPPKEKGKQDCALYYPANTTVKLTAQVNGYLFFGWDGDCTGSDRSVTLTTGDNPKACNVKFQNFACNLEGITLLEDQCYALQLLYTNNNGSKWNGHSNWLETLNPCNWEGVTCNKDGLVQSTEEKPVVIGLDLSSNNLAYGLGGTDLTPLMSTLKTLDLSYNPNLKGALPDWIAAFKSIDQLLTGGTGLCMRLSSDYGTLYYTLLGMLPTCPPAAPLAVFTMSPSPDPTGDRRATRTDPTTSATAPATTSTNTTTADGYTGYTVLLDASWSKPSTANGLLLTYEWKVSDTNKQPYYLETNQTTNNVSPALNQPIKPIAYQVTTDSSKPGVIVTDTPKLTLTFPQSPTGIIYTVSLTVTEDQLDPQGKPVLPPPVDPNLLVKSSATQQLVPLPLATLIISKTGDGSGTVVATQVVRTDPSLPPATCCHSYPSAYFNAAVDSAVELVADAPEGSYFNGWSGDCNPPPTSTSGTSGTGTTTGTSGTSGTGTATGTSGTVRLIIDMTLGEAKTCKADFQVTIPSPLNMHLLTVKPQGAGQGVIQAADGTIACGDDKTDCKENYEDGYHIRLRAVPGLNSNFAIWSSPTNLETSGCTGQKKAVVTIVAPATDRNMECDANFESDSNTGGVVGTDECYSGKCEMDTPEPIDKWFPQHFVNEARMREALSFAEPVKQLLEKQLNLKDLANTWPDQLNDKDFYKKNPVGEWTERVRIRHDAVVDGFLSSVTMKGYYIEVRVKLLTEEGTEKVLPILIYYGDPPTTRSGSRGFTGCGAAVRCSSRC